ncbi:MAG: TrmH family RNA methyltransferase, partial [Bacteroidales bacterium]|nr:TrmH family RNA methyltransferase [Bacteroidales bacterium]
MKDRKLLNIELGRISAEQYKAAEPSGIEVILDNVRSAHNVGSVFRSADAFRVDHIWLCGITALPPSAEIHKTALGAEESVGWDHREDTAA